MNKNKVIFVLVDALGYDVATRHFGFLEHMAESGQGAKYRLRGQLPSLSRPMYETLLTGLPVWRHGITDNGVCRRSRFPSLFRLTKEAGLVNAVAGWGWLLELYGDRPLPFDLNRDRLCLEGSGDIMHGLFYVADEYPDSHLYADGDSLRRLYHPDFLMIHPMGVDNSGHKYGALSREYAAAAGDSGAQIAQRFESWRQDGYQLVVTGDHGMDALGRHEGNEPLQREVPLYIVSDRVLGGDFSQEAPVTTLDVAPLLCNLLGIQPAPGMKTESPIHMKEAKDAHV